jgi:hypothetical protein
MNFNQLVLEALEEATYKVIRDANEQELSLLSKRMSGHLKKPFDKGWLVRLVDRERLIVPNITTGKGVTATGWKYIVFTMRGGFDHYTTINTKVASKRGANSLLLDQAIKKWELFSGLKGDAKETWEDILS